MTVDLQAIFHEPIPEQVYLDPGYSGHANDVWKVRTPSETVVVRAYRWGEPGGPFWGGCNALFGLDPSQSSRLEAINAFLRPISPIPVPRVLRTGELDGRQYVVVEHMPGQPVERFDDVAERVLEQLGHALASLHARRLPYYGHLTREPRHPAASFHVGMIAVMRALVDQFFGDDLALAAALEPTAEAALRLPPPATCAPVMIDLDARQFLADGERLTALVDTEAYVAAPRELDFVALEYILDERGARAVARGYAAVLPLPDLGAVRPVYRYLYRLLEVQGAIELDVWMARPALFGDQDRLSRMK